MARIRSIKPEFPQSESTGKLTRDARLLFLQLFTLADDSGRARAASRLLASLLYPYDKDADGLIEGWLEELDREGMAVRYMVDGTVYIQIVNWALHQKIDKPTPSRLPAFDEGSRILASPREASSTDLGSRILDLGSSSPTPPAPPKGRKEGGKGAPVLEYPEEVIQTGKALAAAFPREWLDQGKVPATKPSDLMDRTALALKEIRKADPKVDAPKLLQEALAVYLHETEAARRYVSGLGVWLSPNPKADKANYRTFLPGAYLRLKRPISQPAYLLEAVQ